MTMKIKITNEADIFGEGYNNGDILEVVEDERHKGGCKVKFPGLPDSTNFPINNEEFEVVEEGTTANDMKQIQVGDKVTLNTTMAKYGAGSTVYGEEGEVSAINGDDAIVIFPSHPSFFAQLSELEPVEKGVEEDDGLKVGDRVRIEQQGYFMRGHEATITEVRRNGDPFGFNVKAEIDEFGEDIFSSKDLVLLEREETVVSLDEGGDLGYEVISDRLEPGDKVVLMEDSGSFFDSYVSDVEEGTVVTIEEVFDENEDHFAHITTTDGENIRADHVKLLDDEDVKRIESQETEGKLLSQTKDGRYSVGDKVEVIKSVGDVVAPDEGFHVHAMNEGDILTIDEIHAEDDTFYEYAVLSNGTHIVTQHGSNSHIRPYVSEDPHVTGSGLFSEAGKTTKDCNGDIVRVGDVVEVVKYNYGNPEGTLFIVKDVIAGHTVKDEMAFNYSPENIKRW